MKKFIPCPNPRCSNGATTELQYLQKIVSLLLLAGSDSARGKRHPYFDLLDRMIGLKGVPNEDMLALTSGLAGRPPDRFFGHDCMDQHRAVRAIIKAAGLPERWGICETCNGDAQIPLPKKARA